MPGLRFSLTTLIVVGFACQRPANVTLRIDDPEGLASDASSLRISYRAEQQIAVEQGLSASPFPTTKSIIRERGVGEDVVLVEALAGQHIRARAEVRVKFERELGEQIPVQLGAPCELPDSDGLRCEIDGIERAFCVDRTCQPSRCGDGVVDVLASPPEECDDRNEIETDGCLPTCRTARCGDGFVRVDVPEGQPGYEACDDANQDPQDACTNDCQQARCGDGIVQTSGSPTGQLEECDDGNMEDSDSCLNSCEFAFCGDGVLRTGLDESDPAYEVCDDGNENELDACNTQCRRPSWAARIVAGEGRQEFDGTIRQAVAAETCKVNTLCDGFLVVDRAGNRVLLVQGTSPNLMVEAFIGNGAAGSSEGQIDLETPLDSPNDVLVTPDGHVFVAHASCVQHRDFVDGRVRTVVGDCSGGLSDPPSGMPISAQLVPLSNPTALAYDSQLRELFVSDYESGSVWRVRLRSSTPIAATAERVIGGSLDRYSTHESVSLPSFGHSLFGPVGLQFLRNDREETSLIVHDQVETVISDEFTLTGGPAESIELAIVALSLDVQEFHLVSVAPSDCSGTCVEPVPRLAGKHLRLDPQTDDPVVFAANPYGASIEQIDLANGESTSIPLPENVFAVNDIEFDISDSMWLIDAAAGQGSSASKDPFVQIESAGSTTVVGGLLDASAPPRTASTSSMAIGLEQPFSWSAGLAFDLDTERIVQFENPSIVRTLIGGGEECFVTGPLRNCVDGVLATSVSLADAYAAGFVVDHQGWLFTTVFPQDFFESDTVTTPFDQSVVTPDGRLYSLDFRPDNDPDSFWITVVVAADDKGVYYNANGALFFADTRDLTNPADSNEAIRLEPKQIVGSLEGNLCVWDEETDIECGIGPGFAPTDARLFPTEVFVADDLLYVADFTGNGVFAMDLREYEPQLVRIAGRPDRASALENQFHSPGPGDALEAQMLKVVALSGTPDGVIFLLDDEEAIRRLTPIYATDGESTLIRNIVGFEQEIVAGSPSRTGLVDEGVSASLARLGTVRSLRVFGESLHVLSGDRFPLNMRRLDFDSDRDLIGAVRTVAGAIYPGDGVFAESVLSDPRDILCLDQVPAAVLGTADAGSACVVLDAGSRTLRATVSSQGRLRSVLGFPNGFDSSGPAYAFAKLDDARALALADDSFFVMGNDGDVLRVDRTDAEWNTTRIEGITTGHRISGAAVNPATGDVFFTSQERNQVLALRSDLETVDVIVNQSRVRGMNQPPDAATVAAETFLNAPNDVALGVDGSLYIADTGNGQILRVVPQDGVVTGQSTVERLSDAVAQLASDPTSLAVDGWGNILVTGNRRAVVIGRSTGQERADTFEIFDAQTYPLTSPLTAVRCLEGASVGSEDGVFMMIDRCLGYVIELSAGSQAL